MNSFVQCFQNDLRFARSMLENCRQTLSEPLLRTDAERSVGIAAKTDSSLRGDHFPNRTLQVFWVDMNRTERTYINVLMNQCANVLIGIGCSRGFAEVIKLLIVSG